MIIFSITLKSVRVNVCSISLIFSNASLQIGTVLISGIKVQTDLKSYVQTYTCMIYSTHTHKHLRTFCDHPFVHKHMFTQIYLLINGPSKEFTGNNFIPAHNDERCFSEPVEEYFALKNA